MSKTWFLILICLSLGLIGGLMLAPFTQPPIDLSCPPCPDPKPVLSLQLQSLDWGEIRRLKLRGDFNWQPQIHAEHLHLDARQPWPLDTSISPHRFPPDR